jgi:hypothetical protein
MADELGQGPAIAETTEAVEADAKPVEANESEAAPDGAKPAETGRDKIQERFDKLTREKYDAMRRADQLEYRLQSLETRLTEAKPQTVAPSPPTLESVGYDEAKFTQALIDYARTTVQTEAKTTFERQMAERTQAEKAATFEAKVTEFAKSKPDYYEKVMAPTLPINQAMAEVIRESDLGPQVAYYLAENPDKAIAISRLSPTAAAREIGRIEARLEVEKAKAKPAVSQAPPPPPKIEAVSEEVDKDPDQMPIGDWVKWREKQLRRKGSR